MRRRHLAPILALAAMLAGSVPLAAAAAAAGDVPTPPPAATFASPEDAIAALIEALKAGDQAALGRVLGPGSAALLRSGDPVEDAHERGSFLKAYAARHELVTEPAGTVVLHVGDNDWPLPIPILRSGEGWHFDAQRGAQEIIDRRIGRDEIAAISVCLAYVDAQRDYFDLVKASTGTGVYAQRLVSTAGKRDGLYWPPAPGTPDSPLQALVSAAVGEGYPGALVAGKPIPYRGYHFRVLTAQGSAVPGGARDYMVKGRMTGGFALLAWPARYGASGIVSFVVGPDGIVFQKDLGPTTPERAAAISRFDPDLSWARIDVTD